jgi:hypothetical protein
MRKEVGTKLLMSPNSRAKLLVCKWKQDNNREKANQTKNVN